MDKKRLLELAGVLNEQLNPEQEFPGYSMTRGDVAELLNYYILDTEGDFEQTKIPNIATFTPDDRRLTDKVCKEFVRTVVDWAMEDAMGDSAPDTVMGAANSALPGFVDQVRKARNCLSNKSRVSKC